MTNEMSSTSKTTKFVTIALYDEYESKVCYIVIKTVFD